MPKARRALPPFFKKREMSNRTPSSLPLSVKEIRPLNIDIPDVVLPRRYKRHGVLLDDIDLDMEKFEMMESPASARPCSEFPPRAGQVVYVGRRTPRFYLAAFQNLANRHLRRTKSSASRRHSTKRRRSVLQVVRDWVEKRRKKRWIEPRRHDGKDLRIFYAVFNLIDKRFGGARLRYREEMTDGFVSYRVKFEHPQRGKVEVIESSLYLAAKEMQYELEFEDVNHDDPLFADLFKVIERKFKGAKVVQKTDKYGRRHVKVVHAICGFRTCASTTEEAVGNLVDLYSNDIGMRRDRKMKRWGGIFDDIEAYYPGSKLFYRQVSHGLWSAKIIHEAEGVIATGRSYTLDFALAQLRNELECIVDHLHDTEGSARRWRC